MTREVQLTEIQIKGLVNFMMDHSKFAKRECFDMSASGKDLEDKMWQDALNVVHELGDSVIKLQDLKDVSSHMTLIF